MNDRSTSIVTASIQLHCQHRFPSQRFCRLPIADPESGLCSKHAAEHQKDNPRRAAVMAYTCNLLLRTLPAIEHELHPELEDQPQIIIDLPRPKRDPLPSESPDRPGHTS